MQEQRMRDGSVKGMKLPVSASLDIDLQQDLNTGKAVGDVHTMSKRKHPSIQPCCRYTLLDISGKNTREKRPGKEGYGAKHRDEFCHDEGLRAQHEICCHNGQRADHHTGRLDVRYWPTSTNLEEWQRCLARCDAI
jgi:hypothetical protein